MPVPVTALYTALLGLVMIALEMPVGMLRGRTKIPIYDGGNMELAVAIRRHGNFIEHVPFVLIVMAVIELNGAGATLLHGMGIALLLARIAHPLGLKHDTIQAPLRAVGAFGTLIVSAVGICIAGWQFLQS